MKICTQCLIEKDFAAFGKDKTGRDGLRSQCRECCVAAAMARRARNPDEHKKRAAKWRDDNCDYMMQARKDYREKTGYEKARYAENKDALLMKAAKWTRDNRPLCTMRQAERRARIKSQTPCWAGNQAILEIYRECAKRRDQGQDVQVDHVVPLNGKSVTGFHCESNLEIIPSAENSSKRNYRWPDMFEGVTLP